MAEDKKEELTPEKAKELLAKEQAGKIANCQREIQAVLDKYGCALDINMILRAGQVIPQANIVLRNS